jgi:ATP-binding cassette, subfamily B, bacterial PglK
MTPQARELLRLWAQLEPKRRRQLGVTAGLLVVSGGLEMLSLGLVFPLLASLMAWGQFGSWGFAGLAAFCMAVLGAGGFRLLTLWANSRLAAAVGSDLAERSWREVLLLPYPELVQLDHSQVVAMLVPQLRQIIQLVLLQALYVVSATGLIAALGAVLLAFAWQAALPALVMLALVYGLLSRLTRDTLVGNGHTAAAEQRQLVRQLHSALQANRERILRGNALKISESYATLDRRMRRLEADNVVLTSMPRFVLEPLGIVTIMVTGFFLLARGEPPERVLPLLGVLAFAVQRLLPLCQQLWGGWAAVSANLVLLQPLLPLLERRSPLPADTARSLQHWQSVDLERVHFAYGEPRQPVVADLSLHLRRGEWFGLRGGSGTGKSTVLDLLMGLLTPEAGALLVDGIPVPSDSQRLRCWQAEVAYLGSGVPLVPGSLLSNILQERPLEEPWFGELLRWLELQPLHNRQLGEGGHQLSGGQRQRVGLARALYGRPTLLILDEATSALDLAAEQRLLVRIKQKCPDMTVGMVSHRDNSLQICNRVLDSTAALYID